MNLYGDHRTDRLRRFMMDAYEDASAQNNGFLITTARWMRAWAINLHHRYRRCIEPRNFFSPDHGFCRTPTR
jgi:hypothetical protein